MLSPSPNSPFPGLLTPEHTWKWSIGHGNDDVIRIAETVAAWYGPICDIAAILGPTPDLGDLLLGVILLLLVL